MVSRDSLAASLAAIILSGNWTREDISIRAHEFLGPAAGSFVQDLATWITEQSPRLYPPSPRQLQATILRYNHFTHIHRSVSIRPRTGDIVTEPPAFAPLPALRDCGVPHLATVGEIARWLELPITQLEWFADTRRRHKAAAMRALQHYHYLWIPKTAGAPRLIEAPKSRLKVIQQTILSGILDRVPAHRCAHGFVKGRSVLTSAHLHAGEDLVITVDLKNFFLTAGLGRIYGIFRSLGFPDAAARILTGLCTTTTPRSVLDAVNGPLRPDWTTRREYQTPHLPQGAPTSPALANLRAYRLDCRLAALAGRLGARYTRYADDLAFSGDATFPNGQGAFLALVARIAREEGFALNARKTRVMRRGARQRITGLVVNQHINVARESYDRLKATLHNCLRHGPADQNRTGHRNFRAHLDGRIAWVESVNPGRGRKLRAMFEAIAWQ